VGISHWQSKDMRKDHCKKKMIITRKSRCQLIKNMPVHQQMDKEKSGLEVSAPMI